MPASCDSCGGMGSLGTVLSVLEGDLCFDCFCLRYPDECSEEPPENPKLPFATRRDFRVWLWGCGIGKIRDPARYEALVRVAWPKGRAEPSALLQGTVDPVSETTSRPFRMTLRLEQQVGERITALAGSNGVSLTALLSALLEEVEITSDHVQRARQIDAFRRRRDV